MSNSPRTARIIKRYANRKMYDTERSTYVTLEEIAEMVRSGQEVQVLDNRTKADLTEVTLAQALVDAERRQRGRLSVDKLKALLATGGEFLQKRIAQPVTSLKEEAGRTVGTWRAEAERSIGSWKEEAERRVDRLLHRGADGSGGAQDADASRVFAGLVEQMTQAFDELQRRLDERARAVALALSRFAHTEDELRDLVQRLSALERRVADLESRTSGRDGPSA